MGSVSFGVVLNIYVAAELFFVTPQENFLRLEAFLRPKGASVTLHPLELLNCLVVRRAGFTFPST
jgi:hypothetical protein